MPGWDEIAGWWQTEVEQDPVYREDVGPMLDRLVQPAARPMIELGCGEGQWLRRIGESTEVFAMDGSLRLLGHAREWATVVCGVLPDLGWLRESVVDTAFSVFVLDLIEDHPRFFSEVARIVKPGGSLAVVINHPAFTAPGAGPFMDPDLDVFWRWGAYLERGSTTIPAGDDSVVMHHRSTADLLTAAARAGWALEEMIEAPLGSAAIERTPSYAGQEAIPRFLGVRWRHRLKSTAGDADTP